MGKYEIIDSVIALDGLITYINTEIYVIISMLIYKYLNINYNIVSPAMRP